MNVRKLQVSRNKGLVTKQLISGVRAQEMGGGLAEWCGLNKIVEVRGH